MRSSVLRLTQPLVLAGPPLRKCFRLVVRKRFQLGREVVESAHPGPLPGRLVVFVGERFHEEVEVSPPCAFGSLFSTLSVLWTRQCCSRTLSSDATFWSRQRHDVPVRLRPDPVARKAANPESFMCHAAASERKTGNRVSGMGPEKAVPPVRLPTPCKLPKIVSCLR